MRIAVIGTGLIGAGMAGSLAREGHDVVVWNRTRSKAEALAGGRITVAPTVAEAVAGAEVVMSVLFDAEATLAVADELAGHLADGARTASARRSPSPRSSRGAGWSLSSR